MKCVRYEIFVAIPDEDYSKSNAWAEELERKLFEALGDRLVETSFDGNTTNIYWPDE